jgi:hypothetical protein
VSLGPLPRARAAQYPGGVSPAVIAIGLTLLALPVAAVVLALREGRTRLVMPGPWLLLVIVLLVVGLVIAPRLLGITFLFLPLLWIRRPRPEDRERRPEDEWGQERDAPDPWDPWDGDR